MESDLVARFEELRPVIRKNWSLQLEEAPLRPGTTSGVVTPAMLVLMLDDTLNLLVERLKAPRSNRRADRDLTTFTATRGGCRCGLHLLLNYYLIGGAVLRNLLPADWRTETNTVMREFNALAHGEMLVLCGVCLHRGGALCSLEALARKCQESR